MLELIMAVIYGMQDTFRLCKGICGFAFYFVFVIPLGLVAITILGVFAIIEFIVQSVKG